MGCPQWSGLLCSTPRRTAASCSRLSVSLAHQLRLCQDHGSLAHTALERLPPLLPLLLPLQSILLGIDGPLVPNTAVAKALGAGDAAKTTTEKAAAAKPAENKATSGRKLLQRSGGAGGGSRNDRAGNWSAMNTQASIRAAATGRAPASYATAAGRSSAQQAGRRCVNCVAW